MVTHRTQLYDLCRLAGLVLLDASHPNQWLRELQLLPPPSPSEPAALTKARATLTAEWADPLHNEEGIDIAASAAQVRATGHFGALPLVSGALWARRDWINGKKAFR